MKVKNNIIILSLDLVGGADDTFILPEIELLKDGFDISVISEKSKSIRQKEECKDFCLYNKPHQSKISKFLYLFKLLFDRVFWQEVNRARKDKARKGSFLGLMKEIAGEKIDSQIYYKQIKRIMKTESGTTILYSYWNAPRFILAMGKIKKKLENNKIIIIARAHNGDLFRERNSFNYQPFKTDCIKLCDELCFISQDGLNYYANTYGADLEKCKLFRLGTNNEVPEENEYSKSEVLKLVSCSYIVEVKRLELLIEAIANIKSLKIEWTHYGNGNGEYCDKVIALAQNLLTRDNIKYSFAGYMPNDELLKEYHKNHYDLFINVSRFEGLPVSIMESMSCSIPVYATDAGGTREIVNGDCGKLFPLDICADELALEIESFAELDETANKILRRNAYQNWSDNFCAANNYKKFAEHLKALCNKEE